MTKSIVTKFYAGYAVLLALVMSAVLMWVAYTDGGWSTLLIAAFIAAASSSFNLETMKRSSLWADSLAITPAVIAVALVVLVVLTLLLPGTLSISDRRVLGWIWPFMSGYGIGVLVIAAYYLVLINWFDDG